MSSRRRGRGESSMERTPQRNLRKRVNADDGVYQGMFDMDDEEEDDDGYIRDQPIAVPPPRITHPPRVRCVPTEVPMSHQLVDPGISTPKRKRRPNTIPFLFTPEQEKDLAEWYRDNPRFYNKRCREFRLTNVKRRMLEEKAKEFLDDEGNACSFLQLSTWMTNMRTYYGKLGNFPNTVGFRTANHKLTERELWIKETFDFLSEHIVRIKGRRRTKSEKHAGSQSRSRARSQRASRAARSQTGSLTGSQAGSQAESILSDAGEDDMMQLMNLEAPLGFKPGTSTGGDTPQGQVRSEGRGEGRGEGHGEGRSEGRGAGQVTETVMMPPAEKAETDKVDVSAIEKICARMMEKGPIQPTASPDSPHSAELKDFARTIVSSMRRIPEDRWNDVKTDIMLVVRNYSSSNHSKRAPPPAPAPAPQYPMGYWPPVPQAPSYDPNAMPGYNYPNAPPGHGYYRPPSGPGTGPPMYPPAPPHMHPAPQQGPRFMQPPAPVSSTTTAPAAAPSVTTATSSAENTSAFGSDDNGGVNTATHKAKKQSSCTTVGHSSKDIDNDFTAEDCSQQCSNEESVAASEASGPHPMKLYSMELCKICKKTLYVTDDEDEEGNKKERLCEGCKLRDSLGEDPGGDMFNCDICARRFTHFRDLAKHTQSHRMGKSHECDICFKCFSDRSGLLRHQKIHSGVKPHQCEICDRRFTLGNALKVHMRTHNKDRPFNCEKCDKTFAQSGHLRSHMKNHSDVTPFGCKRCSASFPKLHLLKAHLRNHGDDRPFKCDLCEKAFNRKSHLKTHMTVHSTERPFECEVCSKTFADQRYLNKHKKVHSGIKPYVCEYCDHRFSQQCYLQTHLMIHTGTKPYVCHLCPKSFRLQEHLKTHLRVHSGTKPFECEVCQKRFTRKDSLGIHIRIHTGDYRYKCEFCSKGFTDPSSFRAHVRSHSGVKPYSCEICGKAYTQNSSLKVHMLNHSQVCDFLGLNPGATSLKRLPDGSLTTFTVGETATKLLPASFINSAAESLPGTSKDTSCVPLDLSVKRTNPQEPLEGEEERLQEESEGEKELSEEEPLKEKIEGENESLEEEPEVLRVQIKEEPFDEALEREGEQLEQEPYDQEPLVHGKSSAGELEKTEQPESKEEMANDETEVDQEAQGSTDWIPFEIKF